MTYIHMKKFKLPIFLLVFALLMSSLYSCNENKKKNKKEDDSKVQPIDSIKDQKIDDDVVEFEITETDAIVTKEKEDPEVIDIVINDVDALISVDPYDNYKVVMSTDSVINLGQTGILDVWIGSEEITYDGPDGTTKDNAIIPKRIGQYAKISPEAQGFEVTGDDGKCYKIDESGSNVRFSLKPLTAGKFLVSAKVEMYKTEDCSDPPVPKYVERLSVHVKVDKEKVRDQKVQELSDIVWENFKKFWGALVALIFGAILFVIRRKIKKTTGYEAPPEEE